MSRLPPFAALVLAAGCANAQLPVDRSAGILRVLDSSATAREAPHVRALYADAEYAPRWLDDAGQPTLAARGLIAELRTLDRRGLDPTAYSATIWDRAAAALFHHDDEAARFDVGLSLAFMQALSDVHRGRVDPSKLGYDLGPAQLPYEPTALARAAIATGRIADAFDQAEPRLAQYRLIKAALARYREIAADTTLARIPAIRDAIRPGDPYPAAPVLRRWLRALGDLPVTESAETTVYTADLAAGVRSFQIRRGLDSDATLTPATADALRVPSTWYVHRLELALERLRWVPEADTGQVIVVNVPAFRLWALDSARSSAPPGLAMNVIVGQAIVRQTPVIRESMRSVIFQPYWDVPLSIVRHEIIPALRRNPRFLDANDMELVAKRPVSDEMAALYAGSIQVRQRPGPGNALGRVKFVIPNARNIYLHDTPTPALFQRARRDFSHGCIRVQNPRALAQYVLRDTPGWTAARIDSAMAGAATFEVVLARPIPVLIFYTTAVVRPDGRVAFYRDVYGLDARLDRALRESCPALRVGGDDAQRFVADQEDAGGKQRPVPAEPCSRGRIGRHDARLRPGTRAARSERVDGDRPDDFDVPRAVEGGELIAR